MIVNLPRCAVCGIPTTPDVKVHWCPMSACEQTQQRYPTPEQSRKYATHDYGTQNVLPRRSHG